MYSPNYLDLALGGIIGYIIGKFGDVLINLVSNFRKAHRRKTLLRKVNLAEHTNILPLDHAQNTYNSTDIHINTSSSKFYLSPPIELLDKLINLFGSKVFKKKDIGLDTFDLEQLPNFSLLLPKHAKIVAKEFIDSHSAVHPLFNSQKLGVSDLKIKRNSHSQQESLQLTLFQTDYFTHRVVRSFYRYMNQELGFSKRLDINFFNQNFKKLSLLNTSFGIYIVMQVDEGLVFCKRSEIVSNSEEGGKWHVTVDEALDMQDLNSVTGTVDILQFAERGLLEELGLSRSTIDQHIDGRIKFLDLFLEKKRYELVLSAFIKLKMSMEDFKQHYKTAKDGDYETTDIICIEKDAVALKKFFQKNQVTDMAKYCVDRIISRRL